MLILKSNGTSKIGVEWTGNDFVLGIVLICIILVCAITSFILKSIKHEIKVEYVFMRKIIS